MGKKVIGVACLGIFLILLFFIFKNHKNTLEDKIIKFCSEDNVVNITLSDFTSFEWDRVIIFTPAATAKEINEAIGLKYNRNIDISAGIIFVKDNEIVYDEIFKDNNDFNNKPSPFIIYPYNKNDDNQIKYMVFTKEEAVFECIQTQYGKDYYYRLYPEN